MLRRLSNFSFSEIVYTINKIFEDYEYKVQWKVDKFKKDIKEFSINLDLSLAYIEDSKIKAISLTCIRDKRARMDSFGVVPLERKKGIATVLLKEQIKLLKSHAIKEYELEVLKTNKRAIMFYKRNGFKIDDTLISLYSPLPPMKSYFYLYEDMREALKLSRKYSRYRKLCWIREPDSLANSKRYNALVNEKKDFYVFYFIDENQCFIVDAFGDKEDKIREGLYSFFEKIGKSLFSIVSISLSDKLYEVLIKNNFMEFSEQWKMKMYL